MGDPKNVRLETKTDGKGTPWVRAVCPDGHGLWFVGHSDVSQHAAIENLKKKLAGMASKGSKDA